MSYLEKAKRALEAQAAAMVPPRCSRCLELEATGIVVLACACGFTTHARRPDRTAEERAACRRLLWTRSPRAERSRPLRLVEGTRGG